MILPLFDARDANQQRVSSRRHVLASEKVDGLDRSDLRDGERLNGSVHDRKPILKVTLTSRIRCNRQRPPSNSFIERAQNGHLHSYAKTHVR